ncbi:EmrB/QacA subfamily drug resistance transporter [Sporomusaceae bacterium BoRhaA]|uniref:MDR family MFS transporter n=1 Tax=Pelorhabdus rhamnosifermentans TaxID=2772457 RepID=UPI001C0619CD|nr:MDR family MFS transporter [Pelorhabdus rhamnosifermentans]MBU2699294.1 EmrB/QacA subfamily drug resistance transporter [Pelorhabdus rhamnosifermentans]
MYGEIGKKRKMIVLAGVLVGVFLIFVDTTVISTAMPQIVASIGGMEYVSWVFTAYMLASIVSIPVFGKLADMYGRKFFYIFGIMLFLIGSILSGASMTMLQLIVFRSLQGVGGGMISANASAVIADVFSPAERGKFQGLLTSVMAIAGVIGPAFGGMITDNLSWRWAFYINIPIGILTILVMWFAFPSIKHDDIKHSIDFSGAALIIVTFVPMLLAFSWAEIKYDWSSKEMLALLAFSGISLLVLIFVESKVKEPITPLSLFKSSIFNISVITSFLSMAVFYGIVMYMPLFVQEVMGKTASGSGAITTPLMLGMVVTTLIGGQTISKTGKYKVINILGFGIVFVGTILLTLMNIRTTSMNVIINMFIIGMGAGLIVPVAVIAVQNAFPHSQVGTVTATLQFFRNLGSTIGVSVFGSILNSTFRRESIGKITTSAEKLVPDNIKAAIFISMHEVFMVAAFVVLTTLILAIFLKELPLRKKNDSWAEECLDTQESILQKEG